MKIKHFYPAVALGAILLAACGKDKGVQTGTFTVTTATATGVTANSAILSGTISNDGTGTAGRGICFGLNNNPTADGGSISSRDADGSGNGNFSVTLNSLMPNTLYHYRAYGYLPNVGGFTYGEDKTFTTAAVAAMATNAATNITAVTAHFTGTYSITDGITASYRGFAYGTDTNPTTSNSYSVQSYQQTTGTGTFEMDAFELAPNTTYYVRAYTQLQDGTIIYDANQQTFKTVGYLGSGGGYVVLDKGDTTGGWRFLEAAPESIMNPVNGAYYTWGCENQVISQTGSALGTGLANTNHIVAGCTEQDCAARACYNYAINGLSDWFLPSQDEMMYTYTTLHALNIIVSQDYWTSTELGQSNASYVYFSLNSVTHNTGVKGYGRYVQPVRRF